jgi:hypothetical protein
VLVFVCASLRRLMSVFAYRYELRREDAVIATGHLSVEDALEVGRELVIGGMRGIVRAVEPLLGERELRLVVEVVPPEPAHDGTR